MQGVQIGGIAGNLASAYSVTCFRGDTRLLAPSGPRRLDEFAENDLVGARNEHDPNGPLEWKRVVRVFKRVASIVELEVRGRTIRTTLEHPFHALEQGWRRTGELQPGDLLVCLGPELVAVEAIRDTGEVTTVYNLEVEDHHTYFVTGDDWGFAVWAHNANYAKTSSVAKGVKGPSGRLSTEKYLDARWEKSTFPNARKSIEYHLIRHGKGRSAVELTQAAERAFNDLTAARTSSVDKLGRKAVKIVSQHGIGLFTPHGKIIWFE